MTLIGQDSRQTVNDRFSRHISSGKAAFYADAGIDFIIGQRDGIRITDLDGHSLINCHSNGGVFNLGHRHPRVVATLQAALTCLDIGNHHLVSEARARLGEQLAAISPGDLNRVVLGVSGGRGD